MALSQSALSELLDAIRAGDGDDVLREAMRLVLQELIELEASQVIGAARYERTDERTTHRNGSRSRLLSTKAGDVELHIPKLREGSSSRRCSSRAGASTGPSGRSSWRPTSTASRRARSTTSCAALGIDAGISKSEVSRICGELDGGRGRLPGAPPRPRRLPLRLPRRDVRQGPRGRLGRVARPSSSPPG